MNVLKTVLKLFGGFKKYDLDRDGKIESLREELSGVLSTFKKAFDEAERINGALADVVNEAALDKQVIQENLDKHVVSEQAKIAQQDKVIAKAQAEIEANKGLQNTLKSFIR